MSILVRIRDWWLGQFQRTGRLGKVALVGVPLLFGCCGLTLASAVVSPPEPTAAPVVVETVEQQVTATARPTEVVEPTATDLPVRPAATATAGGVRQVEPGSIPVVSRTATSAATWTPRPSSTPRPTAPAEPPTATAIPATATQPLATATLPPPTATPARVATIALPTATFPPPPPTAVPTSPPAGNCDPSYPTVCIPPPPPDLDCGDIPHRRFQVLPPDPHRFDGDGNGIGCESD